MEAGPEWSNNKKLVDLSKKDIQHAVSNLLDSDNYVDVNTAELELHTT